MFVDREERTGAVSLANTTSFLDPLVPGLLADLRDAEPRIVEPWTPAPAPVGLGLLGVWFWGPVPYVLRAVPGGLLHLGPMPGRNGRASRFARRPDGTWGGLDGYYVGETLRIADDHLDLGTFVFTRTPTTPRPRCRVESTTAAGSDSALTARRRRPSSSSGPRRRPGGGRRRWPSRSPTTSADR
ncbi:DUF7586 domain-containing protein [Geodermatophilus sp. URMC 64]